MGLLTAIFGLTGLLYAAACGLFFVHLARGGQRSVRWASGTLGLAIVAHLLFLTCDFFLMGRAPTGDIQQVAAVSSLLIAVGYLASMRHHRLTVLGAFITPITLLLFLAAGLRGSVPAVPEHVRSALLPLHIGVNILGIVAFALAFATALAYLIQEQLLRRKQVFGVFQRLPALDVLDTMGLRLVLIGFPLLTLGLVTGSFWAAELRRSAFSLTTAQGFALLAWLFFGAVLIARAAAGWRGRRAAIGTTLGFVSAMAAIAGYLARNLGAG